MEEIKDFVYVCDNALNKDFCEKIIENFDVMESQGFCYTRQESENNISKLQKDDTSIDSGRRISNLDMQCAFGDIIQDFNALINEHTNRYRSNFRVLDDATFFNQSVKIQKTEPGGGYHIWHYETSIPPCRDRILTFIAYLNDVDEGGETEFLYQKRRIKAKQGRLTIFPGEFTHTHRGNPPLSNTKYIVTGWIILA